MWERFIPGIGRGALYKYHVASRYNAYQADKADPYGFAAEIRPQTASKVWDLSVRVEDQEWMESRAGRNALDAPISIYEVHLGSWARVPEEGNRWLTYREMAPKLAEYAHHMGFTHVEFMPVTEHPFDGSWGYQTVGYFAPTSRFGTPQDFMFLVDDAAPARHRRHSRLGAGTLSDRRSRPGLLRRHAPLRACRSAAGAAAGVGHVRLQLRAERGAEFPDQQCDVLVDQYHIDGLRVDAVASMLYLDYARRDGEWIPNRFGGKENLDAVDFLRAANEAVYEAYPAALMIAEESTAWPMVSRPLYLGGLGFGFKWNMGWMHDDAGVHVERPGVPRVSPQPAHVQPDVCLLREFRAAAFAR